MPTIHLRPMTLDDLPLGLRLKQQAGWNQLEADWRRALELEPEGCFVAELDALPVGTVATAVFGDVAWIALVLVDEAARGQGVGRALMQHALAYLDGRGVSAIRLDATPLGRPLYESLGFTTDFALARYEGQPHVPQSTHHAPLGDARGKPRDVPALYQPSDLPDIFAVDRRVTQTDRRGLLVSLFTADPASARIVRRNAQLVGFSTLRLGARATHLGPCLAIDEPAGRAVLADLFQRHASQKIFIDIPDDNRPAVEMALAAGLTIQRPLYRMTRGRRIEEDQRGIWATFGPEKG